MFIFTENHLYYFITTIRSDHTTVHTTQGNHPSCSGNEQRAPPQPGHPNVVTVQGMWP